jgi:hypothetical protein
VDGGVPVDIRQATIVGISIGATISLVLAARRVGATKKSMAAMSGD